MGPQHAAPPSLSERPLPPAPRSIEVDGELKSAELLADYRSYGLAAPAPLTLRYRSSPWLGIPLLLFALFWNGFLVVWYTLALESGSLLMLLFPIGHIAAGVLVTKLALSQLLNRSELVLDANTLHVTTGPVRWPWQPKSIRIELHQLTQLSVLERQQKNSRSYGLIAHLRDGSTRALLEGIGDHAAASFLEHALEKQLGLPDEPWLSAAPPVSLIERLRTL